MSKRQIINIVNFIRGCEPRFRVDLVEPVQQQLALLERFGFRGTFLFQYDALINPAFTDLFDARRRGEQEIGVWLEIVRPLAEAAGVPWRGRYSWDWEANVGFSVGYTPTQRERLVDALFEKFREIFGVYPRVMGSWITDAHTLAYAADRYGLDASCICKDQWGTDGYTLWGGYYNQAYYPARRNAFSPAQTAAGQIGVPVFRMLGSDPVAQYDFGLDPSAGAAPVQGVITLEPVYSGENGGGGEPGWVDWYLDANFSGNCLAFGYTQAGQENSFGWPAMRAGLENQFSRFDRLVRAGRAEVEPLGESGRWFQSAFPQTPATAVAALTHWKDPGKSSVWYNCQNYRLNLYADRAGIRIRDLYLFREDYPERYLDSVCATPWLQFDNLPVMDGNRFSGGGILAGIWLCRGDQPVPASEVTYTEDGEDAICAAYRTEPFGWVRFRADSAGLTVRADRADGLCLRWQACPSDRIPAMEIDGEALELSYRGYAYRLRVERGEILPNHPSGGTPILRPDGENILKLGLI